MIHLFHYHHQSSVQTHMWSYQGCQSRHILIVGYKKYLTFLFIVCLIVTFTLTSKVPQWSSSRPILSYGTHIYVFSSLCCLFHSLMYLFSWNIHPSIFQFSSLIFVFSELSHSINIKKKKRRLLSSMICSFLPNWCRLCCYCFVPTSLLVYFECSSSKTIILTTCQFAFLFVQFYE